MIDLIELLRNDTKKTPGHNKFSVSEKLEKRLFLIKKSNFEKLLKFKGAREIKNSYGRAVLIREKIEFNSSHHTLFEYFFHPGHGLKESTKDVLKEDILFFDCETTGLSHGASTIPFLIGMSYFKARTLVLEQIFIPHFDNEKAGLFEFVNRLRNFKYLVSFNGKSFDVNILESRLIFNFPQYLEELSLKLYPHFDLYHFSRRLWGKILKSLTLSSIEKHILSVHRKDDIPGSLIPPAYFNFLYTGDIEDIKKILRHNYQDILSMVLLYLLFAKKVKTNSFENYDEFIGFVKFLVSRKKFDTALHTVKKWLFEDIRSVDKNDVNIFLKILRNTPVQTSEVVKIYYYLKQIVTEDDLHLLRKIEFFKKRYLKGLID